MRYILLVKMPPPEGEDEVPSFEGWKVAGVTPHDEIASEWEEVNEERVSEGLIESFLVIGHERPSAS